MYEKPSLTKRIIHGLLALDRMDHTIDVEAVPLTCVGLPAAFHLARVAVVADVHLPDHLIGVPRLLRCLQMQKPDAIFLPGDLTNSYTTFDVDGLRDLATRLVAIAPCFAVPGNHELRLNREPLYRQILTECGVHYMCDEYADWHKDGVTLRLYGMGCKRPPRLAVTDQPAIALAHRPEYMPYYREAGWDLVISGHAHGGHVRLGKHSLYAPDQGFFPRYTHGIYTEGNTRMVVSRGLGNSSLPWRMGNHPHLPILILSAKPRLKE